jgi:hypothetical protein
MPQNALHTIHMCRIGLVVSGLFLALNASQSRTAPLPPERPPDFRAENRISTSPGTFPNGDSTTQPGDGKQTHAPDIDACLTRLAALGVSVHAAAAPVDGKACIISMPIRVETVIVRRGPGSLIQFPDLPLIDCRLAEPLARWVGGVVAPVFAASFSSALKAVRTGPGYECRNRNREATSKISAHATGLALDISSFELADGQIVSVGSTSNAVSEAALGTVRTAACGWFTTVLGPGSDAEHENHLHVDIQQHGADGRYRICE